MDIKIVAVVLLIIFPGCAQSQQFLGNRGYNTVAPTFAHTINTVIGQVGNVLQGGQFDATMVRDQAVTAASQSLQSGVWNSYEDGLRERNQQVSDEEQYQMWARRKDRELGINNNGPDQQFKQRYAQERGLQYVP
jgi:hypothetical protein